MTKPLLHWPLPRRPHRTFADLNFLIVDARQHWSPCGLEHHPRMCGMLGRKEKSLCPLGRFVARKDGCRSSEEGWVQVDYGTGNIPIPRSKYEENKYKPDFDKLPSEAEYLAAEKKIEDGAPRT
jgi:hypothetical protein